MRLVLFKIENKMNSKEYWNKELETMSRHDLEKLQVERLRKTIDLAMNSPYYSQVFKELNSYKDLKTNWDGYGGIRPTDNTINSTKKFLEKLKENKISAPSIMVAGSGEVAIFWESKDSYIEVNFDTQEQFSFFYKIDDNIYGEDDIKVDNLPIRLKEALNYLESGVNSENDFFIIQNVA